MDSSAKQQWQAELLAVCCDRSQPRETGHCPRDPYAVDSVKKAALATFPNQPIYPGTAGSAPELTRGE